MKAPARSIALLSMAIALVLGPLSVAHAQKRERSCVVLPEISEEMSKLLREVHLTVSIVGASQDRTPSMMMAHWSRDTGWTDNNRRSWKVVCMPIKHLQDQADPKLQFKLEYHFRELAAAGPHSEQKATVSMPITGREQPRVDPPDPRASPGYIDPYGYYGTAPMPLAVANIDASQLTFVKGDSAPGLKIVRWRIQQGTAAKVGVAHHGREAASRILVEKGKPVSATVSFTCHNPGKPSTQVDWTENGKNLWERPSGLKLVLSQPNCPK